MKTILKRYCLAAVFEVDPDHARWKTEAVTEEELVYPYTARRYLSRTSALKALNGHWGDVVATDATMDCDVYDDLRGYYLGDVVVV
jgi:hypothetical protein